MKISTKFNLLVALFFFFVIMAVMYSYCGGLNVCYSFPFLNGIGRGSKAKVMMTSYIIDEKEGESRDETTNTNTIYIYTKVKDNSNKRQKIFHSKQDIPQDTARRPGNEKDITRNKTGTSSFDHPSVIKGKVAERILRKNNISQEEANRELDREERVDKLVDKEDSIHVKNIPIKVNPIKKDREELGSGRKHRLAYPIRKPSRKIRTKIQANKINSTQDSIDKVLEKKLEKNEQAIRMREFGNKAYSLKKQKTKNPLKDDDEIAINDTEMKNKNYENKAVSSFDTLIYKNEALNEARRPKNETGLKIMVSSNYKQHREITAEAAPGTPLLQRKTHNLKKRKKIYKSEKNFSSEKLKSVITNPKIKSSLKIKIRNSTIADVAANGGHGNKMTSSGLMPLYRNKAKAKVSGSGDGAIDRSLSTGDLIRSIRNIKDQNAKQALQSALKKDEQQLQQDIIKIKHSYKENERHFNLTNVLRELVRVAESDGGGLETIDTLPKTKGVVMKRRSSDKALVRVKRLRNIKRNKASESSLVRVKRIEDDMPRGSKSDRELIRVKRKDDTEDEDETKTQKSKLLYKNVGRKRIRRKRIKRG